MVRKASLPLVLTLHTSSLADHYRIDNVAGSYVLDTRPSSEFGCEQAKDKLINLELCADEAPEIIFKTRGDRLAQDAAHGQAGHAAAGREGRLLRLAGWIDLGSTLTVCAPVSDGINILISHLGGLRRCYLELHIQTKEHRIPTERHSGFGSISDPHDRNVYSFRSDVYQCRYLGLSPDYAVRKSSQFSYPRTQLFGSERKPHNLRVVLPSSAHSTGQTEAPTDISAA